MKVRVTVTLDVDPTAWELEYGIEREDLRQFVQDCSRSDLTEHYLSMGLLAR